MGVKQMFQNALAQQVTEAVNDQARAKAKRLINFGEKDADKIITEIVADALAHSSFANLLKTAGIDKAKLIIMVKEIVQDELT